MRTAAGQLQPECEGSMQRSRRTAGEGVHRHIQAAAVQVEAQGYRNLVAQPAGAEGRLLSTGSDVGCCPR